MYKLAIVAAILATANAGYLGAPAVAPIAYSAAPAVSSSYIHQASAPVAVAHAAPYAVGHAAPYAVAHAAPYAVAHAAPVAVHAPAIGASQQSVVRSLGGNAAVSTYSKAVDSAFSSVRKFDTRVTNDGFAYAHAPVAYAAHAAPVATYAAHAAPVVSTYSHAPVATYAAHAAPVVSAYSHAPVATYAAHAPVAAYAAHGPVVATKSAAIAYSPAAVVSHASFSGLGTSYAW